MFCSECGTKNIKDAKFCENCGHPIIEKTKKEKQKIKKDYHIKEWYSKISKKTKIIVLSFILVLCILIGLFITFSKLASPNHVATAYFEAIIDRDVNKLYSILNLDDSSFTSKEMLKKCLDDDEDYEILNYKIVSSAESSDGLKKTVLFSYISRENTQPQTAKVVLIKNKNKKWLFFDSWTVQSNSIKTVTNFQIKAMKGSKITIEGISLDSYLDSKASTEKMDVYTIPSMFNLNYNAKITLPIGIEVEDTIIVSGDQYTLEIDSSLLPDTTKSQLTDVVNSSLKLFYEAALSGKSFNEIRNNFEYTDADLTNLEKTYNDFTNKLKESSTTLTSINFTQLKIDQIDFTEEGNFYVEIKVSYDFSVNYLDSSGNQKTNQSKDYDYIYFTVDYKDGFHVTNMKGLTTTFSKYF